MRSKGSTVTAFDAKNRLGQLLDRVQAGEELVITRHGTPVARMVPVGDLAEDAVARFLREAKRTRDTLRRRGVVAESGAILRWRDEGRR